MFETEIIIPVRTYDVDFAGVVSNISYARWMEDLRLAMLAKFFPLSKAAALGIYPAIAKTTIVYKYPVKLSDEQINGRIRVSKIGKIKATFSAELFSEGRVHATIEQEGLFLSAQTLRPVKIPEELLALLELDRQNTLDT
ncbi:MAG: thioesterase family protein [Arenicellales bacterium]